MGGNALRVESVRLAAARYREVESDVVNKLRHCLPNRRVEAILAYTDKLDFGDLDVLVEGGPGYDPTAMAQALQATEIVCNGDVTSIGVALQEGVFQVDLIRTPAESFDFTARYFGFNDLGNLVGRIAHKFGAKFGHLGLLYPIRDPDNGGHLIAEVAVTTEFDVALSLLGYDATRYEEMRTCGKFKTLEDIFRFVVSSPYANRAIYLLENRNHASRIRDAKRTTYHAFLDWLAQQPNDALPAYPWAEAGTSDRLDQKNVFLQQAFSRLPAFRKRYDQALAESIRQKQVKARFNGILASEMTGLSGKPLGELMAHIRTSFTDEAALETFFIEASTDEVRARYLDAFTEIVKNCD